MMILRAASGKAVCFGYIVPLSFIIFSLRCAGIRSQRVAGHTIRLIHFHRSPIEKVSASGYPISYDNQLADKINCGKWLFLGYQL